MIHGVPELSTACLRPCEISEADAPSYYALLRLPEVTRTRLVGRVPGDPL